MMHVYDFSSQQKAPDNLQFEAFYWCFGHINGFICNVKITWLWYFIKETVFIVNIFMHITVIVGVCDYIVEMYDFDTKADVL